MKRGIVSVFLLAVSTFAFAGVKIKYTGQGEDGKSFNYVLIADHGKMKMSFIPKDSKNSDRVNIMFINKKMYMVNEEQKSYMDFGAMTRHQNKEENNDVDWSSLKKTGKKLKIASYTCDEYKYTDAKDEKTLYIYVSKNRKLLKSIKTVYKALNQANVGPAIYNGKHRGIMLGMKENGKMTLKATKIVIGKIPSRTFSLKGYKKFDMGGLMNQLKMNMNKMNNDDNDDE